MRDVYAQHKSPEYMKMAHDLLYQVFGWFAVAVLISGITASVAVSIPAFRSFPLMLLLSFAQIGLVFLLSSTLARWSYGAISIMFIVYSILSGVTLSSIGAIYSIDSIAYVFFISASMFIAMAFYGWYTHRDLTQYRSLLLMTLCGLVISLLVNLWLMSSMLDTIVSSLGVLLFSALTAYDIQFIQRMGAYLLSSDEMWHKVALLCALQLYLDFINLFLAMLRLWGRQK